MASQGGSGTSRLTKIQMRFQQKQLEEREQRRMEMTSTKSHVDESASLNSSFGNGKVRQMFDERRRGTGIDKSYPLKPISTKTATTTRSTSGGKTITTNNSAMKTLRTTTTMKKSPINNGRLNNNTITTTTNNDDTNKNSLNNINNNCIGKNNNNNSNLTNVILNKHQPNKNNVSPLGVRSVDDETFPENNTDLGNSEVIGNKLPNVGKFASLSIDDKPMLTTSTINDNLQENNNNIANGIQSKNNIKLKPVLVKKIPSNQITSNTPIQAQKPLKSNVKTFAKSMASIAVDNNMVACTVCNRNFNTDRIEKHEEICRKTAAKQRKQFDASLHRVKGTEAESYIRRTRSNVNKRPLAGQNITTSITSSSSTTTRQNQQQHHPQGTKKSSSWRQKHNEFIEAIRAAKKVQQHLARGGKLSDLPPPPPSENLDYVQCPHCSRRFNEAAANRHIPKCANMLHNKPKPGATKPNNIAAKSSLSTRSPASTKQGLSASSSVLRR